MPIHKPALLCVDDDSQSLTVRRILFEAFGFKVTTSMNPRQGLRLHQTRRFDAAIIDFQMPGMNGAELSLEMKRSRPDVPVMILSGLPQLPAGTEANFDSYVCKGGPSFKLVKEVEKMLESAKPNGHGDHLPLGKRVFAAAGVVIGFATEGAAGLRQRLLPRSTPQCRTRRVASAALLSSSAPHFRAV